MLARRPLAFPRRFGWEVGYAPLPFAFAESPSFLFTVDDPELTCHPSVQLVLRHCSFALLPGRLFRACTFLGAREHHGSSTQWCVPVRSSIRFSSCTMSGSETLEATRRKRPRAARACVFCREKKYRCDELEPCGKCKSKNVAFTRSSTHKVSSFIF